MRMACRVLALAVVLTAACSAGLAAVTPNALFCDNAVLQRGIAVPVWGKADDGETVTVTFQQQRVSTTAKGGKWMVRLQPLSEGGPFAMTIEGSNKIELKNVMVGEVWVCSGQSNMAFALKNAANADGAIARSADAKLRLFTVPRRGVPEPADDIVGTWVEASPETTPGFSAVGYYFGRDLRKTLDVPVGLINTSYGGTRIESWMSEAALKPWLDDLRPEMAKAPNRVAEKDPAFLYNGMVHPLIPYAIRGAIWYQGEANGNRNPYLYRTLLPTMISDWRRNWGQGDFPFLFVQLAPFDKLPLDTSGEKWAVLRESQLLTADTVPRTAMAVITDCGDAQDVHPKMKEPVGARLALAARAIAYGEKIAYRGPRFKSLSFRGDRAMVEFECEGSRLFAKDGDLRGFTVASEDCKFYPARASIVGKKVVVSSPEVAKPAAVRFGWSNCPDVNLFDSTGLPASPFRTDNCPVQ